MKKSPLLRSMLAIIGALAYLTSLPCQAEPANGYTVTSSLPGGAGGLLPYGGLSDGGNGRLYGTTELGGTGAGGGVIFSVDQSGGDYRVVYSFDGAGGGRPFSECVPGPDGLLYGVCAYGGSFETGTLYSIKKDGADFTLLHSFDTDTGTFPLSRVVFSGDTLYGTCNAGGLGKGTVFSYKIGGALTVLHSFDNDGENPYGSLLVASDGRLYGTTFYGGEALGGILYRLDKDGSNFTVIVNFSRPTTGANPYAGVIQGRNGKLYGSTSSGGPDEFNGTLYEVNLDGSEYKIIHTFDIAANVHGPLTQTANGRLYGISSMAGASNLGTIFSLSTTGSDFVTEHVFTGAPLDGAQPQYEALLIVGDRLLGTTFSGGANGAGTIFSLSGPVAPDEVSSDSPGQFYLFSSISPVTAPGTAPVTVRRTGALGAATVAYATANGTALAGRDYTTASGVLTFAAGQTDATISIPLLSTAVNGASFDVTLSNPTGGATLSAAPTIAIPIKATPSPYAAAAAEALVEAGRYFSNGDQAQGYMVYAYYNYYLYLDHPTNTEALNAFWSNLANGYYLAYAEAGNTAAGLAYYHYFRSQMTPSPE